MGIIVKQAFTREQDEQRAVAEIAEGIAQPNARLGVFFCSSRFDTDRLSAALRSIDLPLIGCTTAGELSSMAGFSEGSIVAASLASTELSAQVRMIPRLDALDAARAEELNRELAAARRLPGAPAFGLVLIDGLSMMEERTMATLHAHLGGIPLIGGSAGDDLRFAQTQVFAEGRFATGAAAFCQIETTLPFRTFKWQHFRPTKIKMVITEAEPARRRVMEIDGEPAADAYAAALGLARAELSPAVFSKHPLILAIGDDCYVRALQRVEPDGTLVFYCAIDNGLVLTVAEGVGLVENLDLHLTELKAELGDLQLVIGCDCILRRLEVQQKGLVADVSRLLARQPFLGFSTYGEQYNGIHVNQTLTGVAIGATRSG